MQFTCSILEYPSTSDDDDISISIKPASISPNHAHSGAVVLQSLNRGKVDTRPCTLNVYMLMCPNHVLPWYHTTPPPPPRSPVYDSSSSINTPLLLSRSQYPAPSPPIVRPGPPPPTLSRSCNIYSSGIPSGSAITLRLTSKIHNYHQRITTFWPPSHHATK